MPDKVRIALDAMGGDHGPAVVVAGAELRWRAIPTANSALRRPRGGRAAARRPAGAQGGLAHRSHRSRRPHGRQAEPGAALWALEILDVARHRRGEERRGRCGGLGRQYRRADGDGEIRSQDAGGHRAAGDRRAVADAARANRSCSMSAPRSAPMPSIWSTSPSWAARCARMLFDIERPTVGLLNVGVEEVKGLEQVREAGRMLRERRCPISSIRVSSRATTSARARSTWW